jgi:hypothetical protein
LFKAGEISKNRLKLANLEDLKDFVDKLATNYEKFKVDLMKQRKELASQEWFTAIATKNEELLAQTEQIVL